MRWITITGVGIACVVVIALTVLLRSPRRAPPPTERRFRTSTTREDPVNRFARAEGLELRRGFGALSAYVLLGSPARTADFVVRVRLLRDAEIAAVAGMSPGAARLRAGRTRSLARLAFAEARKGDTRRDVVHELHGASVARVVVPADLASMSNEERTAAAAAAFAAVTKA